MYRVAEQRLSRLINHVPADLLNDSRIGLEKEALRVARDGSLAQTPHPRVLGSALTHPYITTDYSEALLEFITPPERRAEDALEFLAGLEKFVCDRLDDEFLWGASMPCVVAGETSIPIARYGTSNAGVMKTVYRRGLGHRYGRVMQVIAGMHFNYSLPRSFWEAYQAMLGDGGDPVAFVSREYFAMIRNLLRFGWMVPYLFGASPAICKSFLAGKATILESFNENTYYQPYATSLRMGDIGYQNNRENDVGVKVCYDSIDAYVESLRWAIETPCPEYSGIGVKVDGRYEQLNANILQIENEYYSTVRPKQLVSGFEKPILALQRRGVRYVELRSLDVNAFDPLGIDDSQIRFLEALMLFCLLHESPPIDEVERVEIDENEIATAHRGRDPALRLYSGGRERSIRSWAGEVLDAMTGVCQFLDQRVTGTPYTDSLKLQVEAVLDPERTPSARMLAEMRARGEGFFHFTRRKSLEHQAFFEAMSMSAERDRELTELAERSLRRQTEIEASDDVPFDRFLEAYFQQG